MDVKATCQGLNAVQHAASLMKRRTSKRWCLLLLLLFWGSRITAAGCCGPGGRPNMQNIPDLHPRAAALTSWV